MSLTDKLNIAYETLTTAQEVGTARALMQPIRDDVLRIDAELQVIAGNGSFDTVDPEIKQAMLDAWQVIKDAKIAFADATIAELLDWRP